MTLLAGASRSAADAALAPAPPAPTTPAAVHDYSADIAAAKEFQRKGRSKDALALLEADHKIDPKNRDVAVALAQTYSYSGDQGRAIALLDDVLKINSDDTDARTILAQAYSFNHDYGAAEAEFHKVLAALPGDIDAEVGLGQTYTFEGRYADAKKLFASVLAADPRNDDARVGQAEAEAFSGRYDLARSDYAAVLNSHPDNTDALVGLASVDYWTNDIAGATQLDNRALALNPEDSDAVDLKHQLNLQSSPLFDFTTVTSNSTDGTTEDYQAVQRFFVAPTTSVGLVDEYYSISGSGTSVATHRLGFVATYSSPSLVTADFRIDNSKFGGVPSVVDENLALTAVRNDITYGLGQSISGVDGSVAANGGQTAPGQQSAVVRISTLSGSIGYNGRGSAASIAAQAAYYNDGNRYYQWSLDGGHQFGIGAFASVTPDLGFRTSGFSNTYNSLTAAVAPGYYSYQSQRDVFLTVTVNGQVAPRLGAGAITTIGRRSTLVPVYYGGPVQFVSTGSVPFFQFDPYFDYESDRYTLSGAAYFDHFSGGGPLDTYHAATVQLNVAIRLP
ncbi:MAG TPA: tetratricopeptide repeat protein [Casimicrobiaceae bacterium]|nr:tetratricopeptide repeat protein [Casimicrobiaceae bacterium]